MHRHLAWATLALGIAATPPSLADETADKGLQDVAADVVRAIEAQSGPELAALVSPDQPVRFSPSGFVDTDHDLTFDRTQIENFFRDRNSYTWGYEDATGDKIVGTPRDYLEREANTASCSDGIVEINVNQRRQEGTTTQDNIASVYPNARTVEYVCKDAEGGEDGNWTSARLVFDNSSDGRWKLIGIARDERSY